MSDTTRTVWIHIHIPKCGGTSFTSILKHNHGKGFKTTNSILNNYQYDKDQILQILNGFPDCTCLTGHKISLDLPYEARDLKLHVSTFVREPVDRFVSHYFFHRHHTELVPGSKSMNLDEYIDWALGEKHQKMYINGQVRFLSGEATQDGLSKIVNLAGDNRLIILPLYQFDQSLFFLNKEYPLFFNAVDYQVKNVSNKDQTVTEQQKKRINQYCALDAELYRFAEHFLENVTVRLKPTKRNYAKLKNFIKTDGQS